MPINREILSRLVAQLPRTGAAFAAPAHLSPLGHRQL